MNELISRTKVLEIIEAADKANSFLLGHDGMAILKDEIKTIAPCKFIVIWKDGSWKDVDAAFEYENDPDWLATIPLQPTPSLEELLEKLPFSIPTESDVFPKARSKASGICIKSTP